MVFFFNVWLWNSSTNCGLLCFDKFQTVFLQKVFGYNFTCRCSSRKSLINLLRNVPVLFRNPSKILPKICPKIISKFISEISKFLKSYKFVRFLHPWIALGISLEMSRRILLEISVSSKFSPIPLENPTDISDV